MKLVSCWLMYKSATVFENDPKMSHLKCSTVFCLASKGFFSCLFTYFSCLFDEILLLIFGAKIQIFFCLKIKWARFARNFVKLDFLNYFQTVFFFVY